MSRTMSEVLRERANDANRTSEENAELMESAAAELETKDDLLQRLRTWALEAQEWGALAILNRKATPVRRTIHEKLRTQADNRGDDGFDTRLMREAADELEKLRGLLKATHGLSMNPSLRAEIQEALRE